MTEDICTHRHLVVKRKHSCWVTHWYTDGRHEGTRVDVGDSPGTIRIHCLDCGYERQFVQSEPKPGWLTAILAQMDAA